jgi:hypothetical protein
VVKVTARRKSRFEPFLRGTKAFKWASERRYSAFVSVAVLPLGLVPEMTYFDHGCYGCMPRALPHRPNPSKRVQLASVYVRT